MSGRRLALCALAMAACRAAPATEDDVLRLEPAALAGQREAIRALFALTADGAVSEAIAQVLCASARNAPAVFLEELVHDGGWDGAALGSLPCTCGPDLVDDFAALRVELAARERALQAVDVAPLRAARDACVAVLHAEVEARR